MTQDITNLTLIELKALAYDAISQRELAEINLRTINAEIKKKGSEQTS